MHGLAACGRRDGYSVRDPLHDARLIDSLASCPPENLSVEILETLPVIEMPKVGQFMAERVHKTRIFERLA